MIGEQLEHRVRQIKIKCARCNTLVREVDCHIRADTDDVLVTVRCHGDVDTCTIPHRIMLRETIVDATAFKPEGDAATERARLIEIERRKRAAGQ